MLGAVFLWNISIILVSGFIAGCVCKRFKISSLIGYLLVGALIGPGGFDLLGKHRFERAIEAVQMSQRLEEEQQAIQIKRELIEEYEKEHPKPFERAFLQEKKELEDENEQTPQDRKNADAAKKAANDAAAEEAKAQKEFTQDLVEAQRGSELALDGVTEFGVLLLLFAIGIEFTFDKLAATAKYMFVGGTLQMGLTIGLSVLICKLLGMGWIGGLAVGSVVALSSTALVYRSVGDVGQADTKRAQATVGLLIFQDVALVPLLLILPRVLGTASDNSGAMWVGNPWVDMTLKSLTFCAIVLAAKYANIRVVIPSIAAMKSNDMVILYAVVVLAGMCVVAILLGLTPALGALAAGVALGENRLTHQIDALVMPFREAFSAMFFISLGMLTDFSYVFRHPVVCLIALIAVVAFKAVCAAAALRACGMDRKGAIAFGTSIAQVGELAFMILALANEAHAIEESAYNTMLFVSVASLVLTPTLVKTALTKFGMPPEETPQLSGADMLAPEIREAISKAKRHVVIVGVGHIGKRLAESLMDMGVNVAMIDFNPVNLQPFKQIGVGTVAGDGADQDVLRTAGVDYADAIFVTVPKDELALNVVKSARDMNPTLPILARSRYCLNVSPLKRAGANQVFCEEEQLADQLIEILKRYAESVRGQARAAQA